MFSDVNNDGQVDENEIIQEEHYYPFGLRHEGYGRTITHGENDYQYNGKELNTDFGLDMYDYGARFYDASVGRFGVIDRFAEKYFDLNCYQYTANNPILFIDVNGDSINVAGEQDREHLNNSLTEVFGDKAKNFSYTESGNLVYNGKGKKDFKGTQRKAFKGLDKVMSSEKTIGLKYSETHTDTKGKEYNVVDDWGGGLYDSEQNVIVISPNATDVEVDVYSDDPKEKFKNLLKLTPVEQNSTSVLFHEIGEINAGEAEYRGSVIDYENKARSIMGMKLRPYDNRHHHRPKSETQTN